MTQDHWTRGTEAYTARVVAQLKRDFDNRILIPGYSRPYLPTLKPYVREEGDTPDGPEAKFVFAIPTAEMLEALNQDE